MHGLDILETGGEGYRRIVNNAKWTLATLNYAERFDERNLSALERHNATDETFVHSLASVLDFVFTSAA